MSGAEQCGVVTLKKGDKAERVYLFDDGANLESVTDAKYDSGVRYRFRLKRTHDTFETLHGTDGVYWTPYHSETVSMDPTTYVGLAVAATDQNVAASASFTGLGFGGASGNAYPTAVISANPTSGSAPLFVSFDGTGSSDPEGPIANYKWDFGDGIVHSGQSLSTDDHQYQTSGQYTAVLTVTDGQGATDQDAVQINVSSQGGGTGCTGSWTAMTIGSVSTSQVTGSYTITSSGGIFGNSDDFTFLYQECTGDVDIEVEVTSITNANVWGKGGVMIRDELTANSKNAYGIIATAADHRVGMQWRSATGGSTGQDWSWGQNLSVPRWIRITRTGNVFETYHKVDGENWILQETQTVTMGDPVYVGLAVAATSSVDAATAVFEGLSVTGGSASKGYISDVGGEVPSHVNLEQNFPNPFNPTTRIRYGIPESGNVRVVVYDALGRQVAELANGYRDAGISEVNFDARFLPSGVYFYTMETQGKILSRKMILMK